MQATISKMVGGWKGFLLKPADRFFKKNGAGAEIPIYIAGTRDDPHFGYNGWRRKPSRSAPTRNSSKVAAGFCVKTISVHATV